MTLTNTLPPMPTPAYDNRVLYHLSNIGGQAAPRAWAFNGWEAESMSWKTGCYIHAGLSDTGPLIIRGPDALAYLEHLCINSFRRYPIGSMKHAVMCDESGIIAAHGILQRKAEDVFEFFAAPPWPLQRLDSSRWNVQIERSHDYLFQIAGPRSLELLEHLTGESLRDIGFLRFRNSQIGNTRVEVARIGMTGNLAYELHGPMADAPAIYDEVYRAGNAFGLERLGWGTYLVNHVEGGFPQTTWTFITSMGMSPADTLAWVNNVYHVSGSVDPSDLRARYRTPVEVGWHGMCRFDHEFIGRAALEKEVAEPKRTVVTLRWNPEDLADIHASLFRKDEPYKQLDLPYAPNKWPLAHADHLTRDGKPIGYSSGTIYSLYFREVLSMGCIDIDSSAIGTEVEVHWGDHGKRMKSVRAVVERFPWLTQGRNSEVDVSSMR